MDINVRHLIKSFLQSNIGGVHDAAQSVSPNLTSASALSTNTSPEALAGAFHSLPQSPIVRDAFNPLQHAMSLPLSPRHLQHFMHRQNINASPLSPSEMSAASSFADSESDAGSLLGDAESMEALSGFNASGLGSGGVGAGSNNTSALMGYLSGPGQDQKRKKRPRANATQVTVLEQVFAVTHHPDSMKRRQLASQLGMTERSVQIWVSLDLLGPSVILFSEERLMQNETNAWKNRASSKISVLELG
jgi:hypothetical protein